MDKTFGRYRLLERLGEGGMAEVFKAKSFGVEGFEKVLVIKKILPKLAEHPRFVDMFVHEAKLAVRLSHANIVQVFDLGRVDQPTGEATAYFMAMEYVPGLDLATLMSRCRRLKLPQSLGMAVYVAAEVAKALDHAHRRRDEQARPLGIVHRDISPQNILLSWEGEVKVTDFGIAKAKDSIDGEEEADARAGRVRGKLAYMSPEQARGQPLDGRSDLFSLGTVLYEVITGANPFAAPTSFETVRRVQSAEYPPIDLLRPECPKPLSDLVARLLSKEREQRFADAGQLHEALLAYFYSCGDRFGADKMADFLAPFREAHSTSELEAGIVFEDEQTGANDRTPVEVPQSQAVPRTGTPALPVSLAGDKVDTGQLARAAELGERREVTALVVCFTQLRPRTDPGRDGALSGPMDRAREVLGRYGAVILEKEPGQIVALFGLGDADGRDTEAAVRAALVILRSRGGGIAASAGVHVARIIVDPQGAPIKDERLASLIATAQTLARATDGRVAVSALAGRIVRAAFATEDLPGSGGRGASDGGRVVSSARPPAAVYGRFVGRHDELKRLGDILAKATRKRAQLCTVTGDKGIGKTRLLAEMERRLSKGNYNVGYYVAACPLDGERVPSSALTAMLQVLCGIQEGDDEQRILEVTPRLRALGLQDDETAAVLAQLGASARHEPEQNGDGVPAPGAASHSAALRTAFARMVQSLCDDRLHVFAWDDAQAMDRATRETLLASIDRGGGGLRAVFLFATRDSPRGSLAGHPFHHLLPLGELSDDDSARLISTRVGARILPPELIAFCRDRAGGHPLFLEELIKELTDSGAISVYSGAVRARLEGATAVPRTLRTLIAARVSRLPAADRAVLQSAAILGDPVLTEVLAALLGQNLAQIDRAVAGLAGRDLLRVAGPAQVSFSSPMHGEIVLDAIPTEARRELHAAAAAAYIATVGEDGAEHADRIGQHLYQAGDRDRAAGFFARAALARVRLGQLEPAIVHMSRALELCDLDKREATEIAQWVAVFSASVARGRSAPDLPNVTARALRRIDAVGTAEQKVSARVDVARALGSVNLFDAAYDKLAEAFALVEHRDELRSKALSAEIEVAVRSGDFARAVAAADKVETMGTAIEARTLLAIAQARAATGDKVAALRAVDAAEALGDAADLVAASEVEKQRVLVYIYCRDFRAAVEASTRAVDLARSAGLRFEVAAALHNLGDASRRLGDLPRSYATLTDSREAAEAAGQQRLVSLNRVHLAYLDGMSGVATAEDQMRELIRYADARGYWTDALEGRYLLAALLKHRGQREAACRELEDVRRAALAKGNQLIAEDAREALEGL